MEHKKVKERDEHCVNLRLRTKAKLLSLKCEDLIRRGSTRFILYLVNTVHFTLRLDWFRQTSELTTPGSLCLVIASL